MNNFLAQLFFFSAFFFEGTFVFASEVEGGVPTKLILTQVINFSIAVILFVYFTKKIIAKFYSEREQQFYAHVKAAQQAKQEAEAKKKEAQDRLNNLLSKESSNLKTAEVEATQYSEKLLAETKKNAQKLQSDLEKQLSYEKVRAALELREGLLLNSLRVANEKLSSSLDKADQVRLKKEFVEKVKVVH